MSDDVSQDRPEMVIKDQEPPRLWSPGEVEEADDQEPMVVGPDGEPMPAASLVLGIEKFRRPGPKHFRLIWMDQVSGEAWLAEENKTEFRKKHGDGGIVEVGQELARQVGAKRFSEVTR
jgi:hypothetical protein